MKDVLIPLGLCIFIALFIFALIHTARKQRKTKAGVFRSFAKKYGLRYQEEDNGSAQAFAKDFDGIGIFKSPSLGKVIPKNVVTGRINGSQVILFRHMTRFTEGWAREWFVAGIIHSNNIATKCAVQLCQSAKEQNSIYLKGPVVKKGRFGSHHMIVRSEELALAGKMTDDDMLNKLAGFADKLTFRPELQIIDNLVATYPADRNTSLTSLAQLEDLLYFARHVAGV